MKGQALTQKLYVKVFNLYEISVYHMWILLGTHTDVILFSYHHYIKPAFIVHVVFNSHIKTTALGQVVLSQCNNVIFDIIPCKVHI